MVFTCDKDIFKKLLLRIETRATLFVRLAGLVSWQSGQ